MGIAYKTFRKCCREKREKTAEEKRRRVGGGDGGGRKGDGGFPARFTRPRAAAAVHACINIIRGKMCAVPLYGHGRRGLARAPEH